MNLNWKQIMQTVATDDRFYMNTEEDEVTEKEAGWEFLRMYGKDDEEEEQEDDESEFSEEQVESVSVASWLSGIWSSWYMLMDKPYCPTCSAHIYYLFYCFAGGIRRRVGF